MVVERVNEAFVTITEGINTTKRISLCFSKLCTYHHHSAYSVQFWSHISKRMGQNRRFNKGQGMISDLVQ